MATLRDPITGRFTTAEGPKISKKDLKANKAAQKSMKEFGKSLKGFTKTINKTGLSSGKGIGSAVGNSGLSVSKKAGAAIKTKTKDGEGISGEVDSPTSMMSSAMNFVKGIKGLFGKKEDEEGDDDTDRTEELLQKIVDNTEETVKTLTGNSLEDIENKREAERSKGAAGAYERKFAEGAAPSEGDTGDTGSVFGTVVSEVMSTLGAAFTGLRAVATALPAIIAKAMPFLKTGAKFFKQMFKKLFWPVTAIIAIFSFVEGFIEGFKEEGFLGGVKRGYEAAYNNLVDVPLNMLKDMVAWFAGKFGFENVEKALNSFDFDIGGMVADGIEKIADFFSDIPDMLTDLLISLAGMAPMGLGSKALGALGIDVNEHVANKRAKSMGREERDAKTAERRRLKNKRNKDGSKMNEEEIAEMERLQEGEKAKINGVVPLDDEDAEFLAEMEQGASDGASDVKPEINGVVPLDDEDAEFLAEMEQDAQNKKPPKRQRSTTPSSQKSKLSDQVRQIEAAGGTTGVFRKGKLVEVDGKPYSVPGEDSRSTSAKKISSEQIAGAKRQSMPGGGGSNGSGSTQSSDGGGGGSVGAVGIPVQTDMTATDPVLAMPTW